MSGVPTPAVIVEAFCTSGVKNAIPTASQISTNPGAASLTDGFPPATRLAPSSGGIPPSGADMNGILNLATQSLAAIWGGQGFHYNSDFSTNNTGYALGAILASASVPGKFFLNLSAGNVIDPDGAGTNWLPFYPPGQGWLLQQSVTLGSGSTVDQAINVGVGFLDITANAAGSILDSVVPTFDGQILVITNVSANLLTIAALTGATAANQFRLPAGGMSFIQNQSGVFRYSAVITKWVPL